MGIRAAELFYSAYSAVMGLRMTLHYLARDRIPQETTRRPWAAGGKDTYWQSRQKPKG